MNSVRLANLVDSRVGQVGKVSHRVMEQPVKGWLDVVFVAAM